MKLFIAALAASIAAACSTAPPPPLPEPSEIAPGVYLLLKGTQRQMEDIPTLSKVMLFAGDYCAKKNQGPELIVGKEGDLRYLAFKCVPGATWPPKR
jgi:hypothetical protein